MIYKKDNQGTTFSVFFYFLIFSVHLEKKRYLQAMVRKHIQMCASNLLRFLKLSSSELCSKSCFDLFFFPLSGRKDLGTGVVIFVT